MNKKISNKISKKHKECIDNLTPQDLIDIYRYIKEVERDSKNTVKKEITDPCCDLVNDFLDEIF